MSSSSSRRDDRRRVSESDRRNLQYQTTQGGYPVDVARRQADAVGDPRDTQRSRYPREYRNEEGRAPNTRENFDTRTTRRGDERYYEVPVHPPTSTDRFDADRRAASLRQVQNAAPGNLHPNDRRRVAQQPPNDPGRLRQVVAADPHGGPSRSAGMMEHTSATGYERSPYAPMDSSGRREQQRYDDYRGGSASASWPPRDARSEDLTRYETQYSSSRRSGGSSRR
ncbi:hypothetical protein C8A03DRAFT_31454 [Achaetomium macrosporum]|uniref:Uncharacterized protein n=1 Tax=Achaetomium macrosporum TaxID=79813 RepID=A0AAN7CG34_9PEZI|nr:hypothetical protein C8A03DRAFT_31454 [Achaetomium macrosporum]